MRYLHLVFHQDVTCQCEGKRWCHCILLMKWDGYANVFFFEWYVFQLKSEAQTKWHNHCLPWNWSQHCEMWNKFSTIKWSFVLFHLGLFKFIIICFRVQYLWWWFMIHSNFPTSLSLNRHKQTGDIVLSIRQGSQTLMIISCLLINWSLSVVCCCALLLNWNVCFSLSVSTNLSDRIVKTPEAATVISLLKTNCRADVIPACQIQLFITVV